MFATLLDHIALTGAVVTADALPWRQVPVAGPVHPQPKALSR